MARRKIVAFVAGLAALCVALAVGLGGCRDMTFNGDMKGYLEYWLDTVSVASTESNLGKVGQRVSSGRTTVATNATITASLTISNPEGYPLESVVSLASSGPHAVEVSGPAAGTVLGLTSVTESTPTSLEVKIEPYAQVPSWESRRLEHTDFTVEISPTRSETAMQSPNPLVLSLRYNTPPRMPVEVVDDGSGKLGWLDGSNGQWNAATSGSNSGKIFWAWPKGITDSTDPDYMVRFYIDDGSGTSLQYDLETGTTLERNGTVYNVYSCSPTPGGTVKVYAEDGEGVRSSPAESGRNPIKITLDSTEGTFAEGKTQVEMYKTPDSQGTLTITGGDLDVPTAPSRKDLVGWSDSNGGTAITFPYEVKQPPVILYAVWEEDRDWQDGINRKTGEYEKPAQDQDGKYQVANAGNLLWIGQQINSEEFTAFNLKLTADIVVPSGEWVPIWVPDGNSCTFDGQGHSITLNETYSGDGNGLFGSFNYSTIENLVLKGEIRVDTTGDVGAVGGSLYSTTIRNVMSLMNITNNGTGNTGGLAGVLGGGTSIIENCAVYATVTGGGAAGGVGGLVGHTWAGWQQCDIKNSVYMGMVTAPSPQNVGAVAGIYGTADSRSIFENIYYYTPNGTGAIGSSRTQGASPTETNVVPKTEQEIKNDGVSILGSSWELKSGAEYPTLKQNP